MKCTTEIYKYHFWVQIIYLHSFTVISKSLISFRLLFCYTPISISVIFIACEKKIEEGKVEDNNQDTADIGNKTKLDDNINTDEDHPNNINFKIESDEELFLEEIAKHEITFKGLASSSEESQQENSNKDLEKKHSNDEVEMKNNDKENYNKMLSYSSKTSCSDSSEDIDASKVCFQPF